MTEPIVITPELVAEVKRRTPLVELIERNVRLRRSGRDQVGLCPFHKERTPSFFVVEAKGFAHCFGCGWNGDAIKWIMASRGWSFREAVEELAADAGLITLVGPSHNAASQPVALRPVVARPSDKDIEGDKLRAIDVAREMWRAAQPAPGTLVETYLRGRGIRKIPRSLRFAPALPYWHRPDKGDHAICLGRFPAMIGCMQDASDAIVAAHCTYLQPDGSGKLEIYCPVHGDALTPKKVRGAPWGAAIRFNKPRPHAVPGEGIETVLSVRQALQRCLSPVEFNHLWFVAAYSLGNIAGSGEGFGRKRKEPDPDRPDRLPSERPDMERPGIVLPSFVREVTIIEDGDNGDPEAADALYARAADRFKREGRAVRHMRAPAGADFNDVLKGSAPKEANVA